MNDSLQTIDSPRSDTVAETTTHGWCELDERFFRIVAEELSPQFLSGAGALLASYDAE